MQMGLPACALSSPFICKSRPSTQAVSKQRSLQNANSVSQAALHVSLLFFPSASPRWKSTASNHDIPAASQDDSPGPVAEPPGGGRGQPAGEEVLAQGGQGSRERPLASAPAQHVLPPPAPPHRFRLQGVQQAPPGCSLEEGMGR